MTYNDIYRKFLIQYDKADIISSYPSLTKKEVAEVLDKAYLALISQKFIGNDLRKVSFEGDAKAIEDLRPLVNTTKINDNNIQNNVANILNAVSYTLPTDLLYYITSNAIIYDDGSDIVSRSNIILIDHQSAQNFIRTDVNIPWIKSPVCIIEGDKAIIIYDPYMEGVYDVVNVRDICVTYIKKPTLFSNVDPEQWNDITFELNDLMAEELISLALPMQLENVESQRLSSNLQLRQIES